MENDIVKELEKCSVKRFVLAGNAIFTVLSGKTGNRYTYKIVKDKENNIWFVNVLTGRDNDKDYTYICYFKEDLVVKISKKSRMNFDSTPVKVISWMMSHIDRLPESLKVYHVGKCGKCGRTLTTVESIKIGLGPVCVSMKK